MTTAPQLTHELRIRSKIYLGRAPCLGANKEFANL